LLISIKRLFDSNGFFRLKIKLQDEINLILRHE